MQVMRAPLEIVSDSKIKLYKNIKSTYMATGNPEEVIFHAHTVPGIEHK
jgi:hypothetical protein